MGEIKWNDHGQLIYFVKGYINVQSEHGPIKCVH